MFLSVGVVGSGCGQSRRLDRQPEEVTADPLQGHRFEPAEIEQAVVQGGAGGVDQAGRGVLEVHAVKPPYGAQALAAVALAQAGSELGELRGRGGEQTLLSAGLDATLSSAAVAMRFERDAFAEPRFEPVVACHFVVAIEHEDRLERLAHLEPAPDRRLAVGQARRHRVAVGMQVDVAFGVHPPAVKLVHGGDVQR